MLRIALLPAPNVSYLNTLCASCPKMVGNMDLMILIYKIKRLNNAPLAQKN
jgi:hypothetical protein